DPYPDISAAYSAIEHYSLDLCARSALRLRSSRRSRRAEDLHTKRNEMSETHQDETVRSETSARALTHFINGKTVDGTSHRFGDVFNPALGAVSARVPLASVAEVDAAVAAAR